MTPDQENTWRTLKEESPVRGSWLCNFGIHKWTKWGKPFSYGSWWYQGRECVHCHTSGVQEISNQRAAYFEDGK